MSDHELEENAEVVDVIDASAFSETVPFEITYPVRGQGKTFDVSSDVWDSETLMEVTAAPKTGRRSIFAAKESHEPGLFIQGVNVTPKSKRPFEKKYSLETSWPLPTANCEPLHSYADVDLLRMPEEVAYAKGDDINACSENTFSLDAVLRNLDQCIPLSVYPPDVDMDSHTLMLGAREGARTAFRHPTLDVEFTHAPIKSVDEGYGHWPSLKDAETEKKYIPFNSLIAENDPAMMVYYNGLKVDLTKDYSAFFPSFPYISKDHPNRYFSDVASHLRTLRPVWGMFGNDVLARGWNAFAQERIRDRLPSPFYGESLWQGKRDREHDFKAMKLNVFKSIKLPANSYPSWAWSVHAPEKNIAIMMGRRGGDVFAIDIDVTDRVAMGKILGILEREVGLSPFIRVGMWPKVALLYRVADGEKIKSRVLEFGKEDSKDKALGAIEILGEGKPLTAYGIHHSFLASFQWIGSATPAEHGPDIAPELSIADMCRFIDAVSEEVSFLPGYRQERSAVRMDGQGLRDGFMPQRENANYVYDVNGIVVDGRSSFVRDITYEITRRHRDEIVNTPRAVHAELAERITTLIVNTLVARMLCDSGRWTPDALTTSVMSDVQNMMNAAEERLFSRRQDGELIRTPMSPIVLDDEGAVITNVYGSETKVVATRNERSESFIGEVRVIDSEVVSLKRGDDPIPMPSHEQATQISHTLKNVVSSFTQSIYSEESLGGEKPVVVVDAPTGSGKTSSTIEEIVLDPRTLDDHPYYDDRGELKMGRCPIVIAMPTYANISEAMSRAKILSMSPVLTDEELVSSLLEQDCFPDRAEAQRRLPEVRRLIRNANRDPSLPPLDIQVYTGREQAGCPYRRHLAMLAAAHQPADRLCKAEIQKRGPNGEKLVTTEYCPRYESCAYIAQKESVKTAHIVFIPHAFVSNGGLPDALKNARALIIDEQIHQQFLHVAFMRSEDFRISASIFSDWTMRENISEAAVAKIQAHNERQAALREALPLREWLLTTLTETLRYGEDPATEIAKTATCFDMSVWRSYEDSNQEEGDTSVSVLSRDEMSSRINDCLVEYEEDIHDGCEHIISAQEALYRTIEMLESLFKQDVRIKPELLNDRVVEKLSQPGVINAETEMAMWLAVKDRIIDVEKQRSRAIRRAETVEAEVHALERQAEFIGDDDPRFANWRSQARDMLAKWDAENPVRHIHAKDSRFQFVTVRDTVDGGISLVEKIRFSWRTAPGWESTPIMLLDASASPKIISRVFNERPVIMRRIVEDAGSSLNMKIIGVTGHTFSNSSLVASSDATIYGRVKASINMSNIRDALNVICGNHADSRVVMGASKSIREAIITGWQSKPDTLDSCHFGAMRGIDAYKKHSASVCVGRMEPPVEVIDAYAACLSWDDERYEAPFNVYGNGFADADGTRPLFQDKIGREIRLRDGGTATIQTPVVPGQWGRLIQTQTREEEINQFIGRLRPVYRSDDERPVCYVISSIIPEHLILDDVVSLYDIIGTDGCTNKVALKDNGGSSTGELREKHLRQYAMTCIMRAATMAGNRLWPEFLVQSDFAEIIPAYCRSIEGVYDIIASYGFHRDGRRDDEQGFADGWAGIRFDSDEGLESIWTPVAAYASTQDALDNLRNIAIFEANAPVSTVHVLAAPAAVTCFSREKDSVDEMAETGYVMQRTARRGAMTKEEIEEAEYEADLHRKDVVQEFHNGVSELLQMRFPMLIEGRYVELSPIYQVNSHGGDFQYYRLSPALIAALVPGCVNSDNSRIRAEVVSARSRNLTLEQVFALFAIQQIFGPTLADVVQQMKELEFRNRSLLEDTIPEKV